MAKKPIPASETILGHFDDQKVYSGLTRYSDTKLVLNAYVQRLATLIPASEVIVNNFCPGLVATNIDKSMPIWLKPIMFVYRKFAARDVAEGARTLIYASAVAGPETHGKFLNHNEVAM